MLQPDGAAQPELESARRTFFKGSVNCVAAIGRERLANHRVRAIELDNSDAELEVQVGRWPGGSQQLGLKQVLNVERLNTR